MSAFDLTSQSMQCTEPEREYVAPRIKLRDEVFVLMDGKWVNEIYCQPPLAAPQKLFRRKAQHEWNIWEENRALWEENQVLRIENRMLWEENKAFQCLQSQNEAAPLIYTDAIQQSLQKENKPFPFFQERNTGFQVNPDNEVLQAIQENHRVFKHFEQNKAAPITWQDRKAITVCEESQGALSDLQEDVDTFVDVPEGNPGPQQEHEAEKQSTTPSQNKTKSAPSPPGEFEILQALQDLYEYLHVFLKVNDLPGERQDCPMLSNVGRAFQEDYKKLKLQLKAVKNTVSDIKAQMEMLEEELMAITAPMHEEA
ncbi:Spermatid-associated protein, partial [Merops nubicus]